MTRLEALKELAEKVEAGMLTRMLDCRPMNGGGKIQDRQTVLTWKAYHGSLDAALALHEAVLPNYTRDVDATAPDLGIDVTLHPVDADGDAVAKPMIKGSSAVESRAWLLAILRALIAQEEAQ